ncbi:MAG TPA: helix-turn-helix transcriptional regulator [Thermoanaerobaculia bacterium]|nr:helix-turn-helix transcriptional regulator [Thermoanaerobaculia bacterium]
MRADKKKRLEAAGWRLGNAKDFLNLDEVDSQLVEIKLLLARKLRELREQLEITQEELARRLRSSQSRVAKIEAGDPSVSMELLIRSLLAAGADSEDIGRTLTSKRR